MTPDVDIWRAANLIIKQHSENAEIVAAQRADLMLERGDPESRLVWLRIRRAIVDLQAAPRGRLIKGKRANLSLQSTCAVSGLSGRASG